MARIITKGLLGIEDFNLGTSTFTRATSTGGTIVLHQVNATNLGTGGAIFPVNTGPIVPTGLINGSNTTFTLPTTPGNLVLVFRNGLLQQGGGVDYSITGSVVTFNAAPLATDSVLVVY